MSKNWGLKFCDFSFRFLIFARMKIPLQFLNQREVFKSYLLKYLLHSRIFFEKLISWEFNFEF